MIRAHLQAHRAEIVENLIRLARIPSVQGEAAPGAPYGPACREMLEETKKLYAENGFENSDLSDDGYLLTHIGDGEKTIGLFAHGDVVPPGEGWTLTEPFNPIERDGYLIGRGVMDNKSGIIASLYAARAIRDLALPMHSKLMMFTGSNEESGMGDIAAYVRDHQPPEVSLVPDCAFPVYRGEKGCLRFWAVSRRKLEQFVNFHGGEAFNIVLGKVSATLADGQTIEAKGLSKHAALPEGSINAAAVLMDQLPALSDGDREVLAALRHWLSTYDGSVFGIQADDAEFGPTSCVNGMMRMRDGHLCAAFDVRYVQPDGDVLVDTIRQVLDAAGWDIEVVRNSPGYKIPLDDPNLQGLLDAYTECTGEENPMPRLNAGGTYARCLPNAFSMGTCHGPQPSIELPAGHGNVHQPDEVLCVDALLEAIVILVEMLLRLDATL